MTKIQNALVFNLATTLLFWQQAALAEYSIKVTKFGSPINDCYESLSIPFLANTRQDFDQSKVTKSKICNRIEREVSMNGAASFVIANKVSLDQTWSSIRANSRCSSNNMGKDSISYIECEYGTDSQASYAYKYYKNYSAIGLSRITYSTCSHGDWEKIRESIISKFGTNQGVDLPISRYQSSQEILRISNKETGETLEAGIVIGPQKNMTCPGDVRLVIRLRLNDLNRQQAFVEGNGHAKGAPVSRSSVSDPASSNTGNNVSVEQSTSKVLYYTYTEDPYERLLKLFLESERANDSKTSNPKF